MQRVETASGQANPNKPYLCHQPTVLVVLLVLEVSVIVRDVVVSLVLDVSDVELVFVSELVRDCDV